MNNFQGNQGEKTIASTQNHSEKDTGSGKREKVRAASSADKSEELLLPPALLALRLRQRRPPKWLLLISTIQIHQDVGICWYKVSIQSRTSRLKFSKLSQN